jgi:hypothetical protein
VNTKLVCRVDDFNHDLNAFALYQMVADAAEALDDIITQWEVMCILSNPKDFKIYSDFALSASQCPVAGPSAGKEATPGASGHTGRPG